MGYDSFQIFLEVEKRLTANPNIRLQDLTKKLGCSHPTIRKAVLKHTLLSFRAYQKKKLRERVLLLLRTKASIKEIALEVGFKWPEHLSRSIKNLTGHRLSDLRTIDCDQQIAKFS